MANSDYDKEKFDMDEYGNLIPKDGFPKDCKNLIPKEKEKEELTNPSWYRGGRLLNTRAC